LKKIIRIVNARKILKIGKNKEYKCLKISSENSSSYTIAHFYGIPYKSPSSFVINSPDDCSTGAC
jgi:hypothetical protein